MKKQNKQVHEKKKCYVIYGCSICKAGFPRKELLTEHMALVHDGKKPYPCTFCDVRFIRKIELKEHMESVHKKSNPHDICIICESGYKRYY